MELTVNGNEHRVEVPGEMPQLWVLRDLELTGVPASRELSEHLGELQCRISEWS